jgi:hypothetical protein
MADVPSGLSLTPPPICTAYYNANKYGNGNSKDILIIYNSVVVTFHPDSDAAVI